MKAPFRLCLVLTRDACVRDPLEVAEAAGAGGVDCIQMREKDMSSRKLFEWGEILLPVCRKLGVPLVVNDLAEVAVALGADGVHVGQDDMHPEDVRTLVGSDMWVGLSTHDLEQADEAAEIGVDYAGFGPVFATTTKNVGTGLGPDFLAAAVAVARVPLVAIGGILPENAWMVRDQASLAVSSGICSAEDPEAAAAAILGDPA